MRRSSLAAASLAIGCALSPAFAGAAFAFSDVSEKSPEFAAVEFLKAQGIMQGYADNTFRPNQALKRSETVKILVATKLSAEQLATFTTTSYSDVPADAWYRPYVEAAFSKLKLIDGPPKTTTFNGDRTIKKAEFLKLLFASQGVDTNAFSEITQPLSPDVADSSAWFYPALRYAISSSVIQVSSDGLLHPDEQITRGEMAQELYRFAMYQAGRRAQALLSEEEQELQNVLDLISNKEGAQAEYAATRALVAARGALQAKPGVAIVKGAVKIAESFRAITQGYRAGIEGRLQDVIDQSKKAWDLAEAAKTFSPTLQQLASRVQEMAKNMADQARELMKK
jgi:hypothetical protein